MLHDWLFMMLIRLFALPYGHYNRVVHVDIFLVILCRLVDWLHFRPFFIDCAHVPRRRAVRLVYHMLRIGTYWVFECGGFGSLLLCSLLYFGDVFGFSTMSCCFLGH